MATTYEYIYTIQNLINKGKKTDDAPFSDRFIVHLMNTARVLLLKRKADKKQAFDPSDFQSFCMPLCESTWIDCPCLPDIDCKILKGKFQLPKTLVSRTGMYLTVRFMSGKEIGETSPSALQYRQYSLTKVNKPAWFIDNNYLYITGIPFNQLKAVYITGVFLDPTEISSITLCSNPEEDCGDIYEEQYPISGELEDPLYRLVMEYMTMGMKAPDDKANNASATEVMNDKE
jgi:hypothetical protein